MHSTDVEPTAVFQALGDFTRLRILRLLVAFPKEEACLCEFSDSLEEPEYNVSRHLKILRQAGLLSAYKEGRWVYHRLVDDKSMKPFYHLISKLADTEEVFRVDLKRFKAEISKREIDRCRKDGPQFERRARRDIRLGSV